MPTLLLILVAIFWGTSYVFIKIALQEISPLSFVFFRFSAATACLLPSLIFLKGKVKKKDLLRGLKLGGLLWSIIFLQTIGLQTIATSVSSFLMGFAVVFVLFIRYFVQKKVPNILDLAASLTCIVGLGLITQSHGVSWEAGVYYTLISAFFVALYTYALSDYAAHSHLLVLTLAQIFMATLLTGVTAAVVECNVQFPVQVATWVAILTCGVLSSIICSWLQAYAQRYMGAFKAYMITTLEPVFATIFSCLLLGETLSFLFYIGAILILGAIGLINWRIKDLEV